MDTNYKVPPQTRIGHVHLKVAALDRSLAFYCDFPGFEMLKTLTNKLKRVLR